jgi:DNA-binding PadR family transcriptional regulator
MSSLIPSQCEFELIGSSERLLLESFLYQIAKKLYLTLTYIKLRYNIDLMSKDYNQLPQVAFSILLALSLRERHGYEIIKQVQEDSNGKINLGPGALYTSIKQLRANGLILEVLHQDDSRRRYYKLSGAGMKALKEELEYYDSVVSLAGKRKLLNGTIIYVAKT